MLELYPDLAEAPQQEGPKLRDILFPEQLDFLTSEADRKCGVVGRRGGKSTIAAVALAESGLDGRPGVSFYCGITRERAKSVMWRPLKVLNREYGLGFKMNDSELIAYVTDDSVIQITGADKMKEADKKRGDGYKIAIIDECGSFKVYLEEMVQEVIEPALMDYDAPLWLLGSPNESCTGFFHDAATSEELSGWFRRHWDARRNPHINAEAYFKKMQQKYGLDSTDPKFQREYLGLWVKGGKSLLYKFSADINVYNERPSLTDWRYVCGVDLGFEDDCAFVVWAWSKSDPNLYEVQAMKAPHMLPPQVAEVIGSLRDKWGRGMQVIVDEGGLGKMIGEGLRQRFGESVVIPAQKTEKFAMIEFMNGDLRAGRIKLHAKSPIIDEWSSLHLTKEGHEDPTVPNHLADAALYGYRYARQYLWKGPEKEITPEKAMELAVRKQAMARKSAEGNARWL